ncbi:RidA family protein [Ferrovibrio xuzhouensis]|uniref:RidA family protein n=1 Tax=Ferrovibrio xuzhouensis TaxID=1576914 RepID=A0ABV7VJC4_9PROT
MNILEKLASLGLELPNVPQPVGNYRPAKRSGNLVFTSGQTARINGVRRYVGKVGREVSDEDAYLSARDAALNCLACAAWAAGGTDKLRDVIKVLGFINCVDGYEKQPAVINGASDLIEKLFGPLAAHARSAVGVNALPSNVSVELEIIFEAD